MAAFLACKRLSNSAIGLIRLRGFRASNVSSLYGANSKRLLLVDTLAVVRRLEGQGVPSKKAEAISNVLKDTLENISQLFASNGGEMQNELLCNKMNTKIDKVAEKLDTKIDKVAEKLDTNMDKVVANVAVQVANAKDEVLKYGI